MATLPAGALGGCKNDDPTSSAHRDSPNQNEADTMPSAESQPTPSSSGPPLGPPILTPSATGSATGDGRAFTLAEAKDEAERVMRRAGAKEFKRHTVTSSRGESCTVYAERGMARRVTFGRDTYEGFIEVSLGPAEEVLAFLFTQKGKMHLVFFDGQGRPLQHQTGPSFRQLEVRTTVPSDSPELLELTRSCVVGFHQL